MDSEGLRQLLRQSEGLKLDFKRRYAFDHPDRAVREGQWDEFIKDVLALANGNVGVADEQAYLIIGIGDELKADGSRDLFDVGDLNLSTQSILEKVNAACDPPLPDIHCDVVLLDRHRIVVVSIPPSPHLHETTRRLKTSSGTVYPEHTVFVRRAEGIYLASMSERQAILADKRRIRLQAVALDRLEIEKPRFVLDLIQTHRERLAAAPRYARWADRSPDESYISSEAFRLPLFASPYEDIAGPAEELLRSIRSYQRLLVLG
jgi:predicted HTH transcriptional regulator